MLRFHVHNKQHQAQFEHRQGPIEFGRGPQRENIPRHTIQGDLYVSKDHVRLTALPDGRVRVENLSQRNPIWVPEGAALAPGTAEALTLPLRLVVGETVIDVESAAAERPSRQVLATIAEPLRSSVAPGLGLGLASLRSLGESPAPEKLAHWFETVIAIQRAAGGSAQFYDQTARAVVDLVGLDRGLVILRRGDAWEVVARSAPPRPGHREFSRTVLEDVSNDRRTFFQSSVQEDTASSLHGVEAVVASPIFDARDQVAGVVYGSRTEFTPQGIGIGPLEAQVVQLLAAAVGAGLARLEQEAEANRLRFTFEQFFSPRLALELQRNPRLLEGQEREVSILFTDVRGFSRLAERLGPHDSCRLIREVMGHIAGRVRAFDGVVVDYAGDGLVAMWNAPADQPDHAALTCRAAVAVLNELPRLSAAWAERLGGPLALGLGVNTGQALVGNTGSEFKFKYGPLGHTVNLASRVEGATKQMGVPALVTGSTRAQLGDGFATRRLCKARLVGIGEPVDLYELYPGEATPEWCARRDAYEKALALYESGQWSACHRAVSPLALDGREGQYDIPCLNLLTRALECIKSPPQAFCPIVEMSSK